MGAPAARLLDDIPEGEIAKRFTAPQAKLAGSGPLRAVRNRQQVTSDEQIVPAEMVMRSFSPKDIADMVAAPVINGGDAKTVF
jgi:hypothetical protein